jgi:hypothetical protein
VEETAEDEPKPKKKKKKVTAGEEAAGVSEVLASTGEPEGKKKVKLAIIHVNA